VMDFTREKLMKTMKKFLKSHFISGLYVVTVIWIMMFFQTHLSESTPLQRETLDVDRLIEINATNAQHVQQLLSINPTDLLGFSKDTLSFGGVSFIEFHLSPDNKIIVISTAYGVSLMDITTLEVLKQAPFKSIHNLAFLSNSILIAVSEDGD